MNVAYILSGGGAVVKRYKVGASAIAGIPVLDTNTATAGIKNATTTSLADAVGVTIDASTYTTTQATNMIEGVASVVINPDAVLKALMVSAATGNTQLNLTTNSAASTAGTVITITTGDPVPNSPEMLDGTVIGVSGNNVGLTRVITSTDATTATVTVPFPYTIAAGDTFVLVPWNAPGPNGTAMTADLTTDLTAVRADADAASGAIIGVVDLDFDRSLPRTNSFLHLLLKDHVFGTNT